MFEFYTLISYQQSIKNKIINSKNVNINNKKNRPFHVWQD